MKKGQEVVVFVSIQMQRSLSMKCFPIVLECLGSLDLQLQEKIFQQLRHLQDGALFVDIVEKSNYGHCRTTCFTRRPASAGGMYQARNYYTVLALWRISGSPAVELRRKADLRCSLQKKLLRGLWEHLSDTSKGDCVLELPTCTSRWPVQILCL